MPNSAFENVVRDLKAKLEAAGMMTDDFIRVVPPAERKLSGPAQPPRDLIHLTNDQNSVDWEVKSLALLFRGNKKPPEFRSGPPPLEYTNTFMFLEWQLIAYGRKMGFPRDAEFEEVFSLLRRRTDGKSTGALHDFVWQTAALVLAFYPLSKDEFEAIVNRLERSARTFKTYATSHNYMETLDATSPAKLKLLRSR